MLAHGEVAHFSHDDGFGAGDGFGSAFCVCGRAGIIVLAGHQEDFAGAWVHGGTIGLELAVGAEEVHVTFEYVRSALVIVPKRFVAEFSRAMR